MWVKTNDGAYIASQYIVAIGMYNSATQHIVSIATSNATYYISAIFSDANEAEACREAFVNQLIAAEDNNAGYTITPTTTDGSGIIDMNGFTTT